MMLIIFFSFTGKRSDTIDLIGILIPKLRYSYWASWQTLNFMYIVFTVLRITTLPLSNLYVFFMYYHNFPNFLRTLYRFKRVTYLSPGILLLLCDKYDRDVDSQASLKMSELGRGSWFWSESLNEDKKDSLGATRPHALSPLLSYLSIYAISPATGKAKLPVCKWVTMNPRPFSVRSMLLAT